MGEMAGNIHRVFARRQPVEIVGKALPVPVQPFVEDDAGDLLDPFHQFDQRLAVLGLDRGEADPAIAADRSGHAVREAGVEPVVPEELAVIMGVNVDEAGGDDRAIRHR